MLVQMSHPGWVMVSFLTELLSSYGGFGKLPNHRHCANDTEVIDNLLKDTYNKHYIPAYPVQVRVDMWVQEVSAVSELTQDFEIGKMASGGYANAGMSARLNANERLQSMVRCLFLE